MQHGFFLLRYVKLWRQHLDKLIQLMLSGQLYVAVDARRFVGLSAVPDAVDHLQSGASMGKVSAVLCGTN
jgi:NADPH-dependent curcumin reductase CurA